MAEAATLGLPIRAGLHTGEVERVNGNVQGITVEAAAQIARRAHAGKVLVSQTTRDLVHGSGIEFSEAGQHTLEGIPGEWQLLKVHTAERRGV